jgi:SRSO17 transposase
VGGLAPAELAPIRGRLEAFADDVFASLARSDQRARGQCYLRGLMLDGRRKSIEPMAARLGEVHYQALHHFVAASPWDWRPVRRRLAEVMTAALGSTAWVVDDTGFPKDGRCSVGVQRQYSGTLGKTANCQLGVSVNAITEHASCPLDWRRFLPERWDEDAMATRRAACHLPEQVHHRPKWQLVLDMLDELAGWGLRPPVLLADSGYGGSGSSAGGWTPARCPTWWRSGPTPAPTPSRSAAASHRIRDVAAVPGRATATSRPRSPSWSWPRGSRPASS